MSQTKPPAHLSLNPTLLLSTLQDISDSTLANTTCYNLEDELDILVDIEYPNERIKKHVDTCLKFLLPKKKFEQVISTECVTHDSKCFLKTSDPIKSSIHTTSCTMNKPFVSAVATGTTTPTLTVNSLLSCSNPTSELFGKMVSDIFTDEVLGQLMNLIIEAYEPWLKNYNNITTHNNEGQRYEKQLEIYKQIRDLCYQDTNKRQSTHEKNINDVFMDTMSQLQSLLVHLQSLGEPPEEILHILLTAMTNNNNNNNENSTVMNPDNDASPVLSKTCLKESNVFNTNHTNSFHPNSFLDKMSENIKNSSLTDAIKDEEDIDGFLTFIRTIGLDNVNKQDLQQQPNSLNEFVSSKVSEDLIKLFLDNDANHPLMNDKSRTQFINTDETINSMCRQM